MYRIEQLEQSFPNIEWHMPVKVRWPDRVTYACRICIADFGLKNESKHQWPSEEEAMDHIAATHLPKQ